MRICSCCHDPVVYPDDMSDSHLPTQILVHDNLPTFDGEPDWTHSLRTRVSHEHLEKMGMRYKGALGNESNKMWHMPDGRVICADVSSGVGFCVIINGKAQDA